MTLEEAIRHAEEVAEKNEKQYKENPHILGYEEVFYNCDKRAVDYRQLAEWLKELKERRGKDTNVGDIISRQAAIDVIFSEPLYETGMKKRSAEEVVPAIFEK